MFNKVRPYINNGWNDFSYLSSSTGLNVALQGQLLLKLPGHVLNADHNLWDGTNIPGSLCPTLSGFYQNYNLKYQRTLAAPLYCVNIPTSSIINAYQFEVSQYNRCITMPGGWFPADKGTVGTALIINTTHFYNTNLQDAVGLILDQMHDTLTTDYGGVIDLWAELLTEPEYAFPLSDDDYYYIELAENKMMETLGMLLSRDTTLETSESGQSHFETVMDAQAYWISSVENETDTLSVMLKTIFNFDKGIVYHLEGENSSAQSQWSAMQSWCNDDYLEHTDYWLCQLTREAAIKACGNNPDSIANIPECQYSEGENQFVMKDPTLSEGSVIKEDNKISKRLTIYPNPASTLVTVELETNKNETAIIHIYSIDGKCVKTLPNTKLHIGINKLNISIFDIAPGIYTIAIETKTSIWNEKVKVE